MIFLNPGEVFARDPENVNRTPEEQLIYVMALPHIEHETCWCHPVIDLTLNMFEGQDEVWIHHYPH